MRDQYPRIYNIVRKGSVFVSVVLRANPLNISFRRSLASNNLLDWHHLVARVISVQDERKTSIWSLNQYGVFTVHSMYRALVVTNVGP